MIPFVYIVKNNDSLLIKIKFNPIIIQNTFFINLRWLSFE